MKLSRILTEWDHFWFASCQLDAGEAYEDMLTMTIMMNLETPFWDNTGSFVGNGS